MTVSRLAGMVGIGVDRMGGLADRAADPSILRLENLDTDLGPPSGVVEATRQVAGRDDANSYLPFLGADAVRRAAADHVARTSGVESDWNRSTIVTAGGLTGILDVLLAILEPGDEVVLPDPIYVGLVNRVRLAGGVPRFAPYVVDDGVWRLDREALAAVISRRTRAFLMMSPAMPTGAVLRRQDWQTVCDACIATDAWMIWDAAMERILFDGLNPLHPASFPGMAERTITVGSLSKEFRMIGWRVGWVVAPPSIIDAIGLVAISNVVCNVGIAQRAAAVALAAPEADLAAATARWQARRDLLLDQLAAYPLVKPEGGWSLLMDTTKLGMTGEEASRRLFQCGRVASTAMTGWGGPASAGLLRLVFSNEPRRRLRDVGARFDAAFQ